MSTAAVERESGLPESCFESRPMSRSKAARWKRKHCQRQASYLWGQKRIITPVLIPIIYGDGRQALALRPIITRQSHFVLAVDSRIDVDAGHFHDMTDQVYEDIEDRFGPCGCWECRGDGGEYDPDSDVRLMFGQWPTPCFNGGCEWWRLYSGRRR